MRTTLNIDDDLLAVAKKLARQQGASVGQVVSMLMRRALTRAGTSGSAASTELHPASVAGFRPFEPHGSAVTNDLVNRLRDAETA